MSGLASLPYTDDVEFDEIDIVLITHFHLDHCGALPWLMNTDEVRVPTPPPPHHRQPSATSHHRPVLASPRVLHIYRMPRHAGPRALAALAALSRSSAVDAHPS